jgi:hypothetical protein
MKTFFSLALLILLASFTGGKQNKSELILQTTHGSITYTSPTLPSKVDELGNVYFEFKPSSFRGANIEQEGQLSALFSEQTYHTISFKGRLQKPVESMKIGATLKTFANGAISFSGVNQAITVPVTVTRTDIGFEFSTSALLDWARNPQMQEAGKKMNLTGPIRFTLTPVLN